MKTKKTGEEKHYVKLNKRLTKELKQANERIKTFYDENYNAQIEIGKLKKHLESISHENEFLKAKLHLTDDEVKQIVSASKRMDDTCRSLALMNGLWRY